MQERYGKRYSQGYNPGIFEETYERALRLTSIKRCDYILEIGCGNGSFLRKLGRRSKNVFGIDLNKDAIRCLNTKNCSVMDVQDMGFRSDYFDKIFSIHTIEHIPDLEKAFSEIRRVLKKKGKAILVYPFEPIRGLFEIGSSMRVYGHPFYGWKFHLHTLSPSKIEKISKRYGLNVSKSGFMLSRLIGPPWPQFFSVLEKV